MQPATQRERRLSRSAISFEKEQETLGKDKKFSPMWEKALTSHQQERSAFFLSPDKNLAVRSPFRERSASIARPRPSLDSTASPGKADSMKRYSAPLLGPPSSDQSTSQDPEGLHSRRTAFVGTDVTDTSFSDEIRRRFDQQTDTADIVGAWGRYPSHSRAERISSAGHLDAVQTRDFALEAAIKFATGANVESDEEEIDPNERPATPPLSVISCSLYMLIKSMVLRLTLATLTWSVALSFSPEETKLGRKLAALTTLKRLTRLGFRACLLRWPGKVRLCMDTPLLSRERRVGTPKSSRPESSSRLARG
jgi:hypothetical protein